MVWVSEVPRRSSKRKPEQMRILTTASGEKTRSGAKWLEINAEMEAGQSDKGFYH